MQHSPFVWTFYSQEWRETWEIQVREVSMEIQVVKHSPRSTSYFWLRKFWICLLQLCPPNRTFVRVHIDEEDHWRDGHPGVAALLWAEIHQEWYQLAVRRSALHPQPSIAKSQNLLSLLQLSPPSERRTAGSTCWWGRRSPTQTPRPTARRGEVTSPCPGTRRPTRPLQPTWPKPAWAAPTSGCTTFAKRGFLPTWTFRPSASSASGGKGSPAAATTTRTVLRWWRPGSGRTWPAIAPRALSASLKRRVSKLKQTAKCQKI